MNLYEALENYYLKLTAITNKQLNEDFDTDQLNIELLKALCQKIYDKTKSDAKPPVGNQNCMLCTWCMEANIRGLDILPRPVYSPRDVIFTITPYSFIKNGEKETFTSIEEIKEICTEGRYYVHVNWDGSTGGHEFLLIPINKKCYVVDAQSNLVASIDSKNGKEYFDDCNYDNSYLVRIDDKELDTEILKYNNDEYITEWEDSDEDLV